MKHVMVGAVLALGLVLGRSAAAEPLQPKQISADARWVLHLNIDAFRKTALAAHIREEHLDNPEAQQRLAMVQEKLGVNPREDLHGVTLYGHSYQPRHGVALVAVNYDREKLLGLLEKKPNHSTSKYRDYTLHTWTKKGRHKKHEQDADHARHRDENAADKNDKKRADKHKDKDHKGRKRPRTITAAFLENTIVVGSTPQAVQQALDVLDGKQPALGEDSPLLAERLDGTVFYGAATDLGELKKRHFDFFPLAVRVAVLEQGQNVNVALGEHDGQAFYHARFVANSEDVAGQLKTVLQGFQAWLQLQANVNQDFARFAKGLQWNVEGKTMTASWEANADQLVQWLHENFGKKWEHRWKHHRDHHAEHGHKQGHKKREHKERGESVDL